MLGSIRKRHRQIRAVVSLLLSLLAAGTGPSAAQPAPVPPPLDQQQANCTHPQYASDRLVCSDAGLRVTDAQVAALASKPPALAAGAIWEDQPSWLRRRSLCAFEKDHRGCLVAAYADRHAVLSASALTATQPIRCDGAWSGRRLESSALAAAQAVAITENGRLVAVATPPGTAWQPWLAWRAQGSGITLMPQGGASFTCRLGSS